MAIAVEPQQPAFIDRQTLCLAGSTPGLATHAGEDDFAQRLRKNYQPDESNVAEQLILFKGELEKLDGEAFWSRLMTGMTEICHSQFAFVSKRVLIDDQNTAVEMPRIGEVGSCLMATAIYYNNGEAIKGLHHDYKYHAWSCPCAHMKHDKVFLIADHLCDFIQNNPNQFPFEPEAYLAVPLFAEGKCYAHFGMMWTKEGIRKKSKLTWTFIEMFMHALEDLISKKLLTGQSFAKSTEQIQEQSRVIPQTAVTATQSLKVYAKSLSHELRTPMQGVVGMLDLMHATVQEQMENEENQAIRKVFQSLRNNIEVVQDSSKRAIEAADNVVHAYDLNMQVPETPSIDFDTSAGSMGSYFDTKPNMTDGSQIVNPHKRKRSHEPTAQEFRGFNSFRNTLPTPQIDFMPPQSPLRHTYAAEDVSPKRRPPPRFSERISLPRLSSFPPANVDTPVLTPAYRHSNIREVIPIVINDSLRVGGRPDFAVSEPIPLGERIEVRSRSSNGQSSSKVVEWSVQPDVPYMIPIDERDLTKLVGAVFLNALKFTDNGEIEIHVRLSDSKRSVLIDVKDTGTGIPEAFQPELFKAFSKEDDSITRNREGLGLGLMVAKGLARRLGGDLNLVRTAVEGPSHGSEFEIRVPLEAGASVSRATTPSRLTRESSGPRSVPPLTTHDAREAHRTSPLARDQSPLEPASPCRVNKPSKPEAQQSKSVESAKPSMAPMHRRASSTPKQPKPDRRLAQKYPLTFLVAEDNKINRKLLVQMLNTLGYQDVHEAYDGKDAVRVVQKLIHERQGKKRRDSSIRPEGPVDVILMDLWMPEMDGYEATEHIFDMFKADDAGIADIDAPVSASCLPPTVLAVSADVTDEAIDKATKIGMAGYMSKPFKVLDLQKLILEFCVARIESAYP